MQIKIESGHMDFMELANMTRHIQYSYHANKKKDVIQLIEGMVLENCNTVAIHYFVEDVVSWMTTWNVIQNCVCCQWNCDMDPHTTKCN